MRAWQRWAAVGGALLLLVASRQARANSFVGPVMEQPTDPAAMDALANRRAFLAMLRYAEGTADANGYRAMYGHTSARPRLLSSFADHPVATGEWTGERLTDAQCRGAGFGPGCITTAAGAYQMTLPTWRRMKQALSLADFGPPAQDQAALWLIREAGALTDVDAGRFDTAVEKVRRVWASLPGAGYAGQPERSISAVRSVYAGAGGQFA
jgi:muramidase (phage lysozyme)